MKAFRKELTDIINKHGQENHSKTPDFILSDFMGDCLSAFNKAMSKRSSWYNDKSSVLEEEDLSRLRIAEARLIYKAAACTDQIPADLAIEIKRLTEAHDYIFSDREEGYCPLAKACPKHIADEAIKQATQVQEAPANSSIEFYPHKEDYEQAVKDCFGKTPEGEDPIHWFKKQVSNLRYDLEWRRRELNALSRVHEIIDNEDRNDFTLSRALMSKELSSNQSLRGTYISTIARVLEDYIARDISRRGVAELVLLSIFSIKKDPEEEEVYDQAVRECFIDTKE